MVISVDVPPTKLTVWVVVGAVPASVTVSCTAWPTGTGVWVMDAVSQVGNPTPAAVNELIG